MAVQVHPVFTPPSDPNVRIWRYMSLAKFVWMLQTHALYFSRCDLMGDPFEGYATRPQPRYEEEFVNWAKQHPGLVDRI
jgi:hypothetical protein